MVPVHHAQGQIVAAVSRPCQVSQESFTCLLSLVLLLMYLSLLVHVSLASANTPVACSSCCSLLTPLLPLMPILLLRCLMLMITYW